MSQTEIPVSQKRSQETRDRLLNALEELLSEKYFDQITVAEISMRAGVAVGTVYRRFKNKEAFIPVMLEAHRLRQASRVENPEECLKLTGSESLRDALRAIAVYTLKQIKNEEHILRTLYLYARLRPEIVSPDWKTLENNARSEIQQLLEHYRGEIVRENFDQTVTMTLYFLNSVFIERALFSDLSPTWLKVVDDDVFAREMADFAFGYLTTKE